MQFNKNEDIRVFLKALLDETGEGERYYNEIYGILNGCYTTSSEYFGDTRELMKKLVSEEKYAKRKDEMLDLIYEIDCAFRRSNNT